MPMTCIFALEGFNDTQGWRVILREFTQRSLLSQYLMSRHNSDLAGILDVM